MKTFFFAVVWVTVTGLAGGPHAVAADPGKTRGGRVSWARLATPQTQWGRHGDQDPKLAKFIGEQTSLNIEVWCSVTPDRLKDLCAYPFIFAKDLVRLKDAKHIENIGEYLRRGGFICIDPCVNGYTPADKRELIGKYERFFEQLIPESTMEELPDNHEIHRCYFSVALDDLYTPDMLRRGAIKPPQIGLQGIFMNGRLIAVLSVAGLECGWPETPQRAPGCMKLIVNSYIYAMLR